MGKTKKKRTSGGARAHPIGAENGGGEVEGSAPRSEEEIIANILDQLQSSNPEDKVCGCQSLGNLSNNSIIKKILLSQKLVRVVGPLLVETDEMVKLAAAGALRNISGLDPDTAEEMVKQDIMTPVEELFKRFQSRSLGDLKEEDLNLLTEGVNLLWNLVESSNTAFSLLVGSGLLDFNLSLLSLNTNIQLVLAVLNLLAAACDHNRDTSAKVLFAQEKLDTLMLHPTSPLLRIHAALVLVTALDEAVLDNRAFPQLMKTLAETIRSDTRKQICDISSVAPVSEEMEELDTDSTFKETEEFLTCQLTALEILANLCSLGEEADDWESTASDEEEEEEDEEIEDMEDTNGEGLENMNLASSAVIEAVVSFRLLPAVLEKANALPENVVEILKSSKKGLKILKLFENVRIRTFLCLSNLTSSLSLDDLGGPAVLFATWNSLGTIVVQSQDEKLLESASSCMRSVTSKLCSTKEGHTVMNLSQKELEAIVQVGQNSQVGEVRMNVVNIIGDISVMLAKTLKETATVEVFRVLVSWLLDTGCKDPDLRVVAESLDKLFDAFSEDDTDAVFFSLNLLPKLRGILNSMKIKMAQQKRELSADHLGIINMAKLNLQRFIKYKEKRPKV